MASSLPNIPMTSIRAYYQLTKPYRVYANLLVAAAGLAFASADIDWVKLVVVVVGLGGIVASACVFNNYFDRAMDAKMSRTKDRATARGVIRMRGSFVFGTILLVLGAAVLWMYTNPLAFVVAMVGFVTYVFMYTPMKPRTPHALWVGAISGATPPVVGYTAVSSVFDMTAAWLFAFLFIWQVVHFLAIAVYRNEEYAAAGVPMYVHGPYTTSQKKLAKQGFLFSLIVLLAWCVALFVL